jgi:hypothetical protein
MADLHNYKPIANEAHDLAEEGRGRHHHASQLHHRADGAGVRAGSGVDGLGSIIASCS